MDILVTALTTFMGKSHGARPGVQGIFLVTLVRKWAQVRKSMAYSHMAEEQEDRQHFNPGLDEPRAHLCFTASAGHKNSITKIILNNLRKNKHYGVPTLC